MVAVQRLPFAVLESLAWLVRAGEYNRSFDWIYLAFSLGTALVSHRQQRKSFYYAGVTNGGVSLWLKPTTASGSTKPAWAIALIAIGLGGLFAGYALATREQRARSATTTPPAAGRASRSTPSSAPSSERTPRVS